MPTSAEHKNNRKRKTKDPCPGCALHKTLCICSMIPNLDLRTRLSLVVHAKELKRTTNTGSLALKALKNSSMYVRGEGRDALDLSSALCDDYQSLLFYPSADSVLLTKEYLKSFNKPIHLIVPDGNWRQASKVHIRHKELSGIPRVMISDESQSKNYMRIESKPEGMATLQAIAYAMRVIEGEEVYQSLISLYNVKLRATLRGRGQAL